MQLSLALAGAVLLPDIYQFDVQGGFSLCPLLFDFHTCVEPRNGFCCAQPNNKVSSKLGHSQL